ncbi:MAG TPA: amidase [Kofleriaceae bacterium]|jgi:amidase
MNLADLDATAQADLVRTGTATPRELVQAAITRIEARNRELGAVVTPMFDSALADADRVPYGPFRGVPILIKDLGAEVAGVPQASGLRPLKAAKWAPSEDSELVKRLKRAGFIIVGKTNASELGILPASECDAWPPTKNPHDLTRSPGGSSGGSACAVAAGLVPIAHANDGGGSIRIPASCCGLFGLKPSRGRVSFAPGLGDVNGGLVNEHVVARSVRDSAAVLDLLAGVVPGDPYSAPPQLARYSAELAVPAGKLRIGFATRYPHVDGGLAESHPDCLAAVQHAAKLLEARGHVVEPAEIPELHDPDWIPRFLSLWVVGVAMELDETSHKLGRPVVADEVEPLTWALGELGRLISGPIYAEAWRWIHRATRRIAKFWERYDLWLTPTVTQPPVPLHYFRSPPDDPLAGIFRAATFAPFTAVFNATGQPACSLPLYKNAGGLPIGVQLAAAYGREDILLRVASSLMA